MKISTSYMGIPLRSPIVVSACTLSEDIDNILKMEDAGAGAVVMFSLFEEQIQRESALFEKTQAATSNMFAEASDFFPDLDDYHVGTSQYLELLRHAKERSSIPIIASLNAISTEGWVDYARQMEDAGADGLEINVFWIPADIRLSSEDVEQRYIDIIKTVKKQVKIPVSIKLNPYFSSIGNMASRLASNGADGLVLFNRFYQPDFDIQTLTVLNNLQYSDANEIRLPLLWLSVLYGKVDASLAATTGVQSAKEVIKYLLAGADVAMTASALYKYGIEYIGTMHKELGYWMNDMQFGSIDSFKGVLSQQNVSDPDAFERSNYIRILEGAKR